MNAGEDDSFLGPRDLEAESPPTHPSSTEDTLPALYSPAELIVTRIAFALLVGKLELIQTAVVITRTFILQITISLVLNLLLFFAVVRKRKTTPVFYLIICAFFVPDLAFYAKVSLELANWGNSLTPEWAQSDATCAIWQFVSHW